MPGGIDDTVFMQMLRQNALERANRQDQVGQIAGQAASRAAERLGQQRELDLGLAERYGGVAEEMPTQEYMTEQAPQVAEQARAVPRARLGFLEAQQQMGMAESDREMKRQLLGEKLGFKREKLGEDIGYKRERLGMEQGLHDDWDRRRGVMHDQAMEMLQEEMRSRGSIARIQTAATRGDPVARMILALSLEQTKLSGKFNTLMGTGISETAQQRGLIMGQMAVLREKGQDNTPEYAKLQAQLAELE